MAIVADAGLGNKGAPILNVERIAEVRLPNSTVLVRGFVGPARPRVTKPCGQWMLFIVMHQTNGQSLMMPARFLESGIDDLPADAIGSRLKLTPEPAAIRDGSIRKDRSRSRL